MDALKQAEVDQYAGFLDNVAARVDTCLRTGADFVIHGESYLSQDESELAKDLGRQVHDAYFSMQRQKQLNKEKRERDVSISGMVGFGTSIFATSHDSYSLWDWAVGIGVGVTCGYISSKLFLFLDNKSLEKEYTSQVHEIKNNLILELYGFEGIKH